ncbi:hypothetical protein E8E13_009877 [Curvularia kusanoi]|uniref:Uncharacterized protein n=1 Tax=Curvularia kusanoi TaxID=90978 RepID=A0A9P4TKC7_CURKU|nr:hypothetical protein E8E13_009877 [Curvularia kusanoi]
MNYASWIEEKNLKKTFICATLASTLVGTFTASMGLWERVHDRREAHKQKKRDTEQDDNIKKLQERFDEAQKKADKRQEEIDRLRDGRDSGARGGDNRMGYHDDVGNNFERNGMMIQRMYDDMYGRYGNRFARGDAITENQLQAQIIALQQTVITVLQDALNNDRQLTRADMAKLVAASNSAREGSLKALQDQQARLSSGYSNRSPSPQRSIAAPPKRSSQSLVDVPTTLYCRYSLDLQYIPSKPLAASMAPGGSFIEKGYETDIMETREFRLGQSNNRDVDAICRNVESLVKHVGTYHEVDELEREVDLRETLVVDKKRLSLPAPPREGSPLVRERDVVEMRGYR